MSPADPVNEPAAERAPGGTATAIAVVDDDEPAAGTRSDGGRRRGGGGRGTGDGFAPDTALGPGARELWRSARFPLIAAAAVLAVGVLLGFLASQSKRGYLDPDAVDAAGSRAVARLLTDAGVRIERTSTADATLTAAGPGVTVLVTVPDLVPAEQIEPLLATGADVVLVAPTSPEAYLPETEIAGQAAPATRAPRCGFDAAVRAGPATAGGVAYRAPRGADACYPADGGSTLVVSDNGPGAGTGTRGRVVLLGGPYTLTNDGLADEGNAALSTSLLGRHELLVWYRPSLADLALGGGESFWSLLPDWVTPVAVQLGIAAALLALWRARRLGALVREPLPVVVRGVEAVEGRARLYRRAHARGTAAAALRQASTGRLDALTGRPGGLPALVSAVAARAGRPATDVHRLLAGPEPAGDTELVRLADQLDTLEREVRRS